MPNKRLPDICRSQHTESFAVRKPEREHLAAAGYLIFFALLYSALI